MDLPKYIRESKEISRKIPNLYNCKEDCFGCGACFAICPKSGIALNTKGEIFSDDLLFDSKDYTGAISMITDSEGFLYPVIDLSICIGCLKCEKVCPVRNLRDPFNK